ncbi:MAG: hypothetical protein ACTSYQ_03580 [Candidatus Odinarchaeia archaeon]
MVNDWINGGIELIGAYFTWMNAWVLYKDREIKGIYWPAMAFFAFWGLWNLYYYPSLDQWVSFAAGIVLVAGNLAWVAMAINIRYGVCDYIWWHWIIKGNFNHKRMNAVYWYVRSKNLEYSIIQCQKNRDRYERCEVKYDR